MSECWVWPTSASSRYLRTYSVFWAWSSPNTANDLMYYRQTDRQPGRHVHVNHRHVTSLSVSDWQTSSTNINNWRRSQRPVTASWQWRRHVTPVDGRCARPCVALDSLRVDTSTTRPRPINFKLGVRMEDDSPHQPQAPWPSRSKLKVISSHRLYVSSLPLLTSGNKMLYLCH